MTDRWIRTLAPLFLALASAGSILAKAQASPKKAPPEQTGKFKAIWEPVNVKADIQLTSVHFVSADEGWVAGGTNAISGGVILHTTDGGMTWETQIGDPASADRAFSELRFVDGKTGFAVQSVGGGDHRLFRTVDGKTWAPSGVVAQHRADYRFVSAEVGFVARADVILKTSDAGKTWASVHQCRVKTEVEGLTRDVKCQMGALAFADANTGYAVSWALGKGAGVAFLKTTDGGKTWSTTVALPGENGHEGALHFTDASNGVVRMQHGKIYRTSDGGQTWTEVNGKIEGKPDFSFADAEVGWAARYQKVLYTRDGGKSWLSAATKLPAMIQASSLPTRDRGYVVGEHGMVYRYRIVPADFEGKGILPAPVIAGAK